MSEMVNMDGHGRILIPKKFREALGADEFELMLEDGILNLIPVKNPLELFGTLKGLDTGELDGIHGEEHEIDA
ncbi:MAG: hypothetical protein U9R75_07180 [Candidatus Thermoplasmatota archaeon]|nr:hypothetical protein [Candidatus Thermoplasmatota archaeon]